MKTRIRNALLLACVAGLAAVPYVGSAATALPLADPQGLEFSASVPADPQRDEGEPNIEIDRDGRIYTCGPTGFTTGADYMQVSTDGGDQFHLLGLPPRGQLADRGGGDCGLATSPVKTNGFHRLSYAGLADTDFTTGTSADGGRSWASTASSASGVTDRQWLTATDDTTVFMNYNDVAGGLVVQKSTDGGLTYGTKTTVVTDNLFPGPMRSDVTPGHNAVSPDNPLVYFGFNRSSSVNLAWTADLGATWKSCLVTETDGDPSNGFVTVDHDTAGNLYIAYAVKGTDIPFATYFSSLPISKLASCETEDENPGWSKPVQVNRGDVRTTVFPWLAAGGAPGRVAIAYYGTTTAGNAAAGDFKASWDVYVDQSLDALSATSHWAQVKATTHPLHYDQICLSGLACATGGDRTLADFFAIAYNPATKKLSIVYDQSAKKPDEVEGHISIAAVVTQVGGPSNGGGVVSGRAVVRTSSGPDPAGDALAPYSFSTLTPVAVAPPAAVNQPALDLLSADVLPGPDGDGFQVRLEVADLNDAALQSALTGTTAGSLIWAFRFTNGFQPAAASAHWDPVGGFAFGFDQYATAGAQCAGAPSTSNPEPKIEKCLVYPGTDAITGVVNQDAGEILLTVPSSKLLQITGARPVESAAGPGARFYDASAFSFGNPSADPQVQGFMVSPDNTPAFDFFLPGSAPVVEPTPSASVPPPPQPSLSPRPRPLPSTGGLGWPVLALLTVGTALAAVRRTRRGSA